MHFEDFEVGQTFRTGAARLDEPAIIAFAERYDWQPFHTDADAARASPFGGLIASGFQTLLTAFGLTLKAGLWDGTGLGSPGIDSLRWLAPVRPGDTLSVTIEVIATRASRSRPNLGVVTLGNTITRADGEAVMSYELLVMVARRSPDATMVESADTRTDTGHGG
ncbi:MAG: MaoC family dehydratase [Pseudomonadota bacterium]